MNLRVGLIGCGDIGKLRAAALARVGSLQLVAVNDINRKRAVAVTERYGGVVDEDWRALIRRDGIDAVIVSTPPHLHAQICIEALESGKHLLCEKPLARTPDECQKILDAAQKKDLFLATGFNYRFYPSIQKARELLDSGIIGELDHIRSYAGYSAAEHGQPWVHDVEVVGGGALRDNGIHLIDLTSYFLGGVEEIKGFASNAVWGFDGCEDNGFALLRNATGKIASLHASWTEWGRYKFLIEIYGTRGLIRASCFPMFIQVAWSNNHGGRMHKKFHFFPFINLMEKLRSYRWLVEQSLIQELEAFHLAIRGGTTVIATGQDGKRAVYIAHSVSQSPNN
jgi:predicted dehydrogenase